MDTCFSVKLVALFGFLCWNLRTCMCRAIADMSSRTVNTRYGQIKGALLKFSDEGLKPVEAFRSLQYASTLGTQMRFMPPTSPSERWKYIRVAFSYRSVCPQPLVKEDQLLRIMPIGEVERRKRIASYITEQTEECLNLNLYVPTGKWHVCLVAMYK